MSKGISYCEWCLRPKADDIPCGCEAETALAEKDARIVALEAENARLREALAIVPPDRIHLLIAFLDLEQSKGRWGGSSGEYEVQNDLRRFEALARAAIKDGGK